MVTHRQQPATAKGTVFLNLEDETGLVNVICAKGVWKRFRTVAARCARAARARRAREAPRRDQPRGRPHHPPPISLAGATDGRVDELRRDVPTEAGPGRTRRRTPAISAGRERSSDIGRRRDRRPGDEWRATEGATGMTVTLGPCISADSHVTEPPGTTSTASIPRIRDRAPRMHHHDEARRRDADRQRQEPRAVLVGRRGGPADRRSAARQRQALRGPLAAAVGIRSPASPTRTPTVSSPK